MTTRFPPLLLIALGLALTPLARGQTLEVLHLFKGYPSEGQWPAAPLVQGADGCLYGTTEGGGIAGNGTVFKITTNGVLTTLVSFTNSNGAYPEAGLLEGSDGSFYGTTYEGGASNLGTVFKMTANGTLTTLVSFNKTNGARPSAELIQGSDGSFYGTSRGGEPWSPDYGNGTNAFGTIFKMTSNGILTTLVSFNNTNGASPRARLVQGSNGNFYGTTSGGGTGTIRSGTVFTMTTNGLLTTLFSFEGYGYDDGNPNDGLVEGRDGNFYGTTPTGGLLDFGSGTIFKITTNGELTRVIVFRGTNGAQPQTEMTQGSDGNFYGTTFVGHDSYGTVFKLTANGVLTTLVSFNGSVCAYPMGRLIQARDGNLYGTTYFGGTNSGGTIYRIVMPVSLNSRVSGNELILSWPTNALGFTLQAAADLNSPTNWIDSTNAPAVVGAQFTITNNLSASAQFYRLKKP